ncbi:MAG: class I SAM-dependent methyltransferase [Vicinamibacterales bacterium]
MPTVASQGNSDDLVRLRREREDAERAYGEALTALDAAVHRLRALPAAPPAYDEHQITPLNQQWELLKHRPQERGGLFGRIRTHMWAMVAPLFSRQETFNATLVDHINRNVTSHRETTHALAAALAVQRDEMARLLDFQTRLILWAQQITAYVDTKDRYVARLPSGLATIIGRVGDELLRRWESAAATGQRHEAQIADLRTTIGVVQRATHTLRRELEQRGGGSAGIETGKAAAVPSAGSSLDSYKYVGFEDNFRGSVKEIRERQAEYLPLFDGASDVVDIGCGRGEFLDLLRERGISAKGVDVNDEMAAICRARGLEATAGEALAYLESLPDESIGGLFAAQVVEHLEPQYLMRLLDTAYQKMRPGSKIVLETINPACWYAFFSSYIRDLTHVRPIHPETLRYLLVASGFQRTELKYSAPFPEDAKLQPIRLRSDEGGNADAGDPMARNAAVFNENVDKLNELLFTYLDYAAIGERI